MIIERTIIETRRVEHDVEVQLDVIPRQTQARSTKVTILQVLGDPREAPTVRVTLHCERTTKAGEKSWQGATSFNLRGLDADPSGWSAKMANGLFTTFTPETLERLRELRATALAEFNSIEWEGVTPDA